MVGDLEDVRKNARERMKGICGVYKVCDARQDRLCMGQKFGAPIGLGGTGKGLSFKANIDALDRLKLRTNLVGAHENPGISARFFGKQVASPFTASSLSGVKASMGGAITEKEFATAILQGCKDFGNIGLIGNTADDGEEETGVGAVGEIGVGVPIFKPQKNSRLFELIKMAEDAGANAVGVDLDGVGSTNWEREGKRVFRKSAAEIHELAGSTSLPFIAKGIMSVDDALACVDAGVDAIDVSNHGGRAQDSTRGVADVLPEIAGAVRTASRGGNIQISAGGGVRTSFDVMKMLALGADHVLIGRDIARAAIGGGAEGVRLHLEYVASDLKRAMLYAGCNRISDIGPHVFDKTECCKCHE